MAALNGNLGALLPGGSGTPNYAGAASDLFEGGGALASGLIGAESSRAAATEYGYAQTFTKEQTALSEAMATRELYQTQSSVRADVAGNGFQLSGSAQDVLRSNAQQGAMTKGAIAMQGAAQEQAYLEQQKGAKQAGQGQLISGIIGGLPGAIEAFS